MPDFVGFTIYAPLGSWGSPSKSSATTAYRPTDLWPTRSALVGIVAAALGRPRAQLPALAAALKFACRTDVEPLPQGSADYHTVTLPPSAPGSQPRNRFEQVRPALSQPGMGSMLSRREYFQNGLWTVLVQGDPGCSLDELMERLNRPIFPLFVGRKCFSFGWPPDAKLVRGEDLLECFAAYQPPPQLCAMLERTRKTPVEQVWIRMDESLESELASRDRKQLRRHRRWDFTVAAPGESTARRFASRVELEHVVSARASE